MSLQAKNRKKRGMSVVIGYVLLMVISIVISVLVYQWIRTYVPTESVACDDGTSIFLKQITYNCTSKTIDVLVKNNGKFSVEGYFIHASNLSDTNALATIDLSPRVLSGGEKSVNAIVFSSQVSNSLTPDPPSNEKDTLFNVTGITGINKIEIIPIRLQTVDDKQRIVSCSDAKIEENVNCVY